MNTAAYHHYALDYSLLAGIMFVLFVVLVVAAMIHGRRQRSRPQD